MISGTPLSHSFESALDLDHEKYASAIIERTEIKDILSESGFSKNDVNDITGFILGKHAIFPLGNQLIHSELDADKLDYLLRDSFHCGVKYGIYDLKRLLISLKVLEEPDYRIVVTQRGFDVAEEFVLARFFMYKQVYIHKTKRAFEILLQEALMRLKEKELFHYPNCSEELDELADKDDIWLFSELRRIYRSSDNSVDDKLKELLRMLLYRDPLRVPERNGEHEEYIEEDRQQFTRKFLLLERFKENVRVINMLKSSGIRDDLVFVDVPNLKVKETPYSLPGKEEEEREEKGIWVLDRNGEVKEITELYGSLVRDIARKRLFLVRIYTTLEYREKLDEVLGKYLKGI